MARMFTRAQALQKQAFLKALERTGNIRLAARQTDLQYGTVQHRRRHHPDFAQQCDAALAVAHARLQEAGGLKRPSAGKDEAAPGYRTRGGEGVVVRRRDGKLQLRNAQPGKLTRECEQAFLAALSASANVRLSAAAGASVAAFYRRRRQNPGFAVRCGWRWRWAMSGWRWPCWRLCIPAAMPTMAGVTMIPRRSRK